MKTIFCFNKVLCRYIMLLILLSTSPSVFAATCGLDYILKNAPENNTGTSVSEWNRLYPDTISISELMIKNPVIINYRGSINEIDTYIEKNSINFTKNIIDFSEITNQRALSGLATDFNTRRNSCKFNSAGTPVPCPKYFDYSNVKQALINLESIDSTFKGFACTGDSVNNIRDVAGFLANISQETNAGTPPLKVGLAWGMTKNQETFSMPQDDESGTNIQGKLCNPYGIQRNPAFLCPSKVVSTQFCDDYTAFCKQYPYANDDISIVVPPEFHYFGRGPKQLTTFGNYLVYGGYVFPHDRLKIVKKPSLLVDNPVIGWGTAFAFYIKPYVQQTTTTMNTIITTERPSMHQVMMPDGFQKLDNSTVIDKGQHGEFGFGQTINVINGSMECKNELTVLSLNRINAYIEALIRLGAPIKNVKVTFSDGSSEIIDVNHLKSNVFHPIKFIKSSSWEAFYNSAPLPLKYYNLNTQSNEKAIKSIELYYGDTSNIKRERLDCIGYSVWS